MAAANIQPLTFKELSASVTKFIAEEEAEVGDGISVAMAMHLRIAIENAANIFKDCPPDQQPSLNAKIGDFQRMLAALKKTDYCSLNLPARIQHSIDSCTSDGSLPLVYSTYPQHIVPVQNIVPGLEVTIDVFGKFKYANKQKYGDAYRPTLYFGERECELIATNPHALKFTLWFPDVTKSFKDNKCSHLDVRLVVPYEAGYLRMIKPNIRTFEYILPIRALPINAGVIVLTSERTDKPTRTIQSIMGWGASQTITLDPTTTDKFSFTNFEGLKQEFTAKDLYAEFTTSKDSWHTKRVDYLTMTTYPSAPSHAHSWLLTTVPPASL